MKEEAVAAAADRIGPDRHDLSKRAINLFSAPAVISMITAAVACGGRIRAFPGIMLSMPGIGIAH